MPKTTHTRIALTLAAAALYCLLGGCAAQQIHPGAINGFDSSSYDTLLVTHNVIETTKADLASGAINAAYAPKVKAALNNLIAAYDAADTAYIAYHTAAAAGTSTPAQATAVSDGVQGINNASAALTAAKAGN